MSLAHGATLARHNLPERRKEAAEHRRVFVIDVREVVEAEIALAWFFLLLVLSSHNIRTEYLQP